MDPVLQAALDRQAEIREALDKITVFIETYRSLAGSVSDDTANTTGTKPVRRLLARRVADPLMPKASGTIEVSEADSKPKRVTDNPDPRLVVREATALILSAGKPMTRRLIHTELAKRGIVVNGADPVKALGTMLWRSGKDELIALDRFGYWIKGRPYLPAHYYPPTDVPSQPSLSEEF